MPGFDRTGPMGAGPMTGGMRGRCAYRRAGASPDYGAAGYGGGFSRGFQGGRRPVGRGHANRPGFGWSPPAAASGYVMEPSEELAYLKQQATEMTAALKAINNRIDMLTPESPESE